MSAAHLLFGKMACVTCTARAALSETTIGGWAIFPFDPDSYNATSSDHIVKDDHFYLALSAGDNVLFDKVESGYAHGLVNGVGPGWYPRHFIREHHLTSPPVTVGKWSFDPSSYNAFNAEHCLDEGEPYIALEVGDIVVIDKCEEGWAHGCVNKNGPGWFPHCFVIDVCLPRPLKVDNMQQQELKLHGPSDTAEMDLLFPVLGDWVDHKKPPSHYRVTLDHDCKGCSVETWRPAGEKRFTQGLIKLVKTWTQDRGQSTVMVQWGKKYYLKLSPGTPEQIQWVHVQNNGTGLNFFWSRSVPKQDPPYEPNHSGANVIIICGLPLSTRDNSPPSHCSRLYAHRCAWFRVCFCHPNFIPLQSTH